ncbi:DgyrCDS8109 [Dimorphilus gyrociliatus]|uniref:DgyrCDS8109 n=1 Tax=Dimorphilus gyrociliatus TaxID=2664684 RepID=A0A7I8VVM6_9ANNE|nr:DgyrCDS8109 [Dimorphilus gyrociliatus]
MRKTTELIVLLILTCTSVLNSKITTHQCTTLNGISVNEGNTDYCLYIRDSNAADGSNNCAQDSTVIYPLLPSDVNNKFKNERIWTKYISTSSNIYGSIKETAESQQSTIDEDDEIGCYNDVSIAPDLPHKSPLAPIFVTKLNCKLSCLQLNVGNNNGFKYAGIQHDGVSPSCYCGNSFGKYNKAQNSFCSIACSDGSICGGNGVNFIYNATLLTWSTTEPTSDCVTASKNSPLQTDNCNIKKPFIDAKFNYHTVTKSFTEAQKFCRDSQTTLLTIKTAEDYNKLQTKISTDQVWLGYTKRIFCDSGKCITFNSNWKTITDCNAPDNQCVVLSNDGLDCANCASTNKIICKTEIDDPTTAKTTTKQPTTTQKPTTPTTKPTIKLTTITTTSKNVVLTTKKVQHTLPPAKTSTTQKIIEKTTLLTTSFISKLTSTTNKIYESTKPTQSSTTLLPNTTDPPIGESVKNSSDTFDKAIIIVIVIMVISLVVMILLACYGFVAKGLLLKSFKFSSYIIKLEESQHEANLHSSKVTDSTNALDNPKNNMEFSMKNSSTISS